MINIYPQPGTTIEGTVQTENVQQESLFHELARQLGIIRQHQEIITDIQLTEETKE